MASNKTKVTTANDIKVAINNAISLTLSSEDAPSKARFRRIAQYARAYAEPMREHLNDGTLLSPHEATVILLTTALLVFLPALPETDRKVPTQEVLNVMFNEETAE